MSVDASLDDARRSGTISRLPVRFGQSFGWLHLPALTSADIAAVICTGLGRDGSNAHRSLRLLADRLAEEGYPALRFDYPGCGDSLDVDAADGWSSWRESVAQAADWVRRVTGAGRLVLIGLRLGASLAALEASARDDVAGLVLLEPVLRGRSFATQLTVEARLRANGSKSGDVVEVNELQLTAGTLASIASIDLRRVTLGQARQVSVFRQADTQLLSDCAAAWREQGVTVECLEFSGLEVLLQPSHLASERLDPSPILSWLQAAVPPRLERRPDDRPVVSRVAMQPAGCVETPVRFGEDDRLFGMLCQPTGSEPDLVVVIGNTGGDPHYGFARFSVELARRLARAGIASFRIDFAGLGDSAAASIDDETTNHPFTTDRMTDIVAALDSMEGFGYRRFALNGLCSGAYHAFHGALTDTRVSELVLINLPFFTMRLDRPGPNSVARRGLTELSRRRVHTLLLFAAEDTGVKMLEQHFGPSSSDLQGSSAAVAILADLDHDLTGSAMRRTVADRIVEFLLSSVPARCFVAAE